MFIELLVAFINLLKNQGQARYYNPEDIISAFNRSQLDLFREYFKQFEETREISDSLLPFKIDHTIATVAEINQLPTDYSHLTQFSVLIGTQEYPGKIVTDELWNVRELSVIQQYFGDNVDPFKHDEDIILISGSSGPLPDDYVDYIEGDAFTGGEFKAEVDITDEHQFVRRKNDRTYPPTELHPIGWIGGNKITLAPDTLTKVKLYYYRYPAPTRPICRVSANDKLLVKSITGIDEIRISYLKTPPDAVYAYTTVSSRDLLFDEGNSIDTIFKAEDHSALVLKTIQYLGVPLKDNILMQFTQMKSDIKPEKDGR